MNIDRKIIALNWLSLSNLFFLLQKLKIKCLKNFITAECSIQWISEHLRYILYIHTIHSFNVNIILYI